LIQTGLDHCEPAIVLALKDRVAILRDDPAAGVGMKITKSSIRAGNPLTTRPFACNRQGRMVSALEQKINLFAVLGAPMVDRIVIDGRQQFSGVGGTAYLVCRPAVAFNGEDFNPHLAAASAMRLSAVTISEDCSWRAVAM